MKDAECPYCGADVEISHDDGYGLDEDKTYEQECPECDKAFAFTTFISFSYTTRKADCLNGGESRMEKVVHAPRVYPDWVRCRDCGREERGQYRERDRVTPTPAQSGAGS